MFGVYQPPEELRGFYEDALAGDTDSIRELADHLIYWNPNGIPSKEEIRVARRFYREAIKAGDTSAMLNYGGLFRDGIGTRENHVAEHFWYLIAIFAYKKDPWKDRSGYRALGNSWKYDYDDIGQPTPTKCRLRLLFALYWFRLGAKEEEMNSLYELGDYYRDGLFVKKDLEKAFSLYIEALDAIETGPCPEHDDNYDDVVFRLAQCYRLGLGTEKNLYKALKFAELSEKKYREIVDNGGVWDQKNLDEAKVEVVRIHRALKTEKSV